MFLLLILNKFVSKFLLKYKWSSIRFAKLNQIISIYIKWIHDKASGNRFFKNFFGLVLWIRPYILSMKIFINRTRLLLAILTLLQICLSDVCLTECITATVLQANRGGNRDTIWDYIMCFAIGWYGVRIVWHIVHWSYGIYEYNKYGTTTHLRMVYGGIPFSHEALNESAVKTVQSIQTEVAEKAIREALKEALNEPSKQSLTSLISDTKNGVKTQINDEAFVKLMQEAIDKAVKQAHLKVGEEIDGNELKKAFGEVIRHFINEN